MRILFFGDSITYGAGDLSGGWVQRLKESYGVASGNQYECYNLGIVGDVASGVVRRLALETESRRWFDEDLAIVIAIGLHDSLYHNGKPISDPDLYKGELGQILSAARQYTSRILFVGLTPVDDETCDPSKHEFGYRNARVREFDAALRSFCDENAVPAAKVYDVLQKSQSAESQLADGLHPNKKGHEVIAECVKSELNALLTIGTSQKH